MFGRFKGNPTTSDHGGARRTPGSVDGTARSTAGASHQINGQPQDLQAGSVKGVSDQLAKSGDRNAPPDQGVLRFASTSLQRAEDLALYRVPFVRCVNSEVGISAHLYVSIAIVQAVSDAKIAVLLLTEAVSPNEIDELLDLLSQAGWSLPNDGTQAWRAASQIIVSVSQGHLGDQQISSARSIFANKELTHLWQSFVNVTQWAVDQSVNDMDFVVREREELSQIAFKIDGRYIAPERWLIPTDTMMQMLGVAYQRSEGGADPNFQVHAEQQARLSVDLAAGETVRLRWSGLSTDIGTVVTMRIQRMGASSTLHTLEAAGCLDWQSKTLKRVLLSQGGLVSFSGKVGSGKSVTLAILMTMLGQHQKIVEVSDPVEIDLGHKVHQKTVIRDVTKTGPESERQFAAAVRGLFRSALDVCLLGEIRDIETGLVARAIMESGHSVYTTTHSPSALGIFAKYASPQVGIPMDVLATPDNIRLNVYQTLVAKLCPHCAMTLQQHADLLDAAGRDEQARYFDRIERLFGLDRSKYRLRNPHGCHSCQNVDLPSRNGHAGRTLAMEMVEPDEFMCSLIQNNDRVGLVRYWRSLASKRYDDPDLTGKTAMECAIYKAQRGEIDPREIELQFEHFETVEHKRAPPRNSGSFMRPETDRLTSQLNGTAATSSATLGVPHTAGVPAIRSTSNSSFESQEAA